MDEVLFGGREERLEFLRPHGFLAGERFRACSGLKSNSQAFSAEAFRAPASWKPTDLRTHFARFPLILNPASCPRRE